MRSWREARVEAMYSKAIIPDFTSLTYLYLYNWGARAP